MLLSLLVPRDSFIIIAYFNKKGNSYFSCFVGFNQGTFYPSQKAQKTEIPHQKNVISPIILSHRFKNAEEYACRNCGADNACNIRTHCVHEKEVAGIFLLTDLL